MVDKIVDDVKKLEAPPMAPASVGENAKSDPDDSSFTSEVPPTPDTMPTAEAYGAEEVQVTDLHFDNPLFQLLHKHPIVMTIGVMVLGGIIVGATAMGLRGAKCAISRGF